MQFNFPRDYRKYLKWLILAGIVLVILIIVLSCARSNRSANQNPSQLDNLWQGGTALPQTTTDWDSWAGTETPAPTSAPALTAQPMPTVSVQPTATASTSVRKGDTGETVKYIQQRLKTLGYYTSSVDGDFGVGTENAVKAFQKTNDLTADGVVGTRTMDVLKSDKAKSGTTPSSGSSSKDTSKATSVPARREYKPSEPGKYGYLELGSSGSAVRKLQNRLAELGYLSSGDVSGTYDETTENAVIVFQERNGEWSDGKAGPDTQTKLYSDKALQASSSD